MKNLRGAKIALLFENKIIVYLRDNKSDIPFANMWDFPGGGSEGDESPFECIAREVWEEFAIRLRPEQIVWQKEYASWENESKIAYFFAAHLSKDQVESIQFGEEGQRWRFIEPDELMASPDFVPHLKQRFSDFIGGSK